MVDGVALTADPVGLAGLCPRGGAGEEKMTGEFDFYRTAGTCCEQRLTQERAELPGGVLVEGEKAQLRFLLSEEGKIAGECFWRFRRAHGLPIYSVMSMTSVDLMSAVTVAPTSMPISSTL